MSVNRLTRRPRVGERRVYEGQIEVLYPGEQALAEIPPVATSAAKMPGERIRFIITPAPGVHAFLRRWRYRLSGDPR